MMWRGAWRIWSVCRRGWRGGDTICLRMRGGRSCWRSGWTRFHGSRQPREMDEEQKNFLDGRLNNLAEQQPAILLLRDRLLNLNGTHLVAPTEPDPDVDSLLVSGSVMEGAVHFEEMAENSCHWNVAALWL